MCKQTKFCTGLNLLESSQGYLDWRRRSLLFLIFPAGGVLVGLGHDRALRYASAIAL